MGRLQRTIHFDLGEHPVVEEYPKSPDGKPGFVCVSSGLKYDECTLFFRNLEDLYRWASVIVSETEELMRAGEEPESNIEQGGIHEVA